MPAIITNKFRIHNAEQFYESFIESSSNTYYLMIGRPQPFTTSTRPDGRTENEGSDTSPILPVDCVVDEFYNFDDVIAAKKITSSDISFVVPRINWTTGTVYDMYRHDYGRRITGTTTVQTASSGATNLFDALFYVLNSNNHVYKCLDNNSGAASTVEPTGTSTSILTTADGYKWKYMYSLSASQGTNFLSTDFMAVTINSNASSGQSSVISAAVDGALDIVTIKSAGSGYTISGGGTSGTITGVPIRGDGSSGVCSIEITSGVITDVTITTPGTGYTIAYITNSDIQTATNSGGTGSGAELDVIIPPKGGHGSIAIKELGAFYIMLNTSFEGVEAGAGSDVSAENDFRKVALIRDPLTNNSASTATTLRGTKAIRFAASPTPGTFTSDEEINQATTGAVGKVVEWDATNRILYYIQTRFNDEGADANGDITAFSGTGSITGQSSTATGTPDTGFTDTVNGASFTSGYSLPEIDADNGHILYVENRAPILRASDQTENIKLIIEF